MPECRKKLVRHRHFFRLSGVSVRHRHSGISVQSGTAGHGLVRHCPAFLYAYFVHVEASSSVLLSTGQGNATGTHLST
jgi:hypothetical protein